MKTILFILGCGLISLGMSDFSNESSLHSNAAKSTFSHIIYWALLSIENIGKYTLPIIGLVMILASALIGIKNKDKKEKSSNNSK